MPAATLASVAPVTILTGDWIGNSIDAHLLKIVLEEARRMAKQVDESSIARLERCCLGFLKVVGIPAKLRVHVTSDLELLWASLADGQIQIYAESWLEEEGVLLAT